MSEFTEKSKDFLKQNAGYIIIFLASCVYIISGLITISETGKSITSIIVDGALAFLFGFFISRIFDLQGMMNGDRDERVKKTYKLHDDIVTRISPYIDKLDDWCEWKNKEALKVGRIRILSRGGLKYEDYFDENGVAKHYDIDKSKLVHDGKFKDKAEKVKFNLERENEKRKYAAYKKACGLKITLLTSNILTSEGGREDDPFNFGLTKRQYETKASIKDSISKICIAIITGLYSVRLIESFSWAFLIWTGVQVLLFLVIGVIKLYQSYMFVTDDFRSRIIKKIDKLSQFECDVKRENNNNNDIIVTVNDENKPEQNNNEVVEKGEIENVNEI